MAVGVAGEPCEPLPRGQPRFERVVAQAVEAELARPARGGVRDDPRPRVIEFHQALGRFGEPQREHVGLERPGLQRLALPVADPGSVEFELAAESLPEQAFRLTQVSRGHGDNLGASRCKWPADSRFAEIGNIRIPMIPNSINSA